MDSTDKTSITELWYSMCHDELAALIQEAANEDGEDGLDACAHC